MVLGDRAPLCPCYLRTSPVVFSESCKIPRGWKKDTWVISGNGKERGVRQDMEGRKGAPCHPFLQTDLQCVMHSTTFSAWLTRLRFCALRGTCIERHAAGSLFRIGHTRQLIALTLTPTSSNESYLAHPTTRRHASRATGREFYAMEVEMHRRGVPRILHWKVFTVHEFSKRGTS